MCISMKEIWRNLDGPPKNKDVWSYVVKFEFGRQKSSSFNVFRKKSTFILSPKTNWNVSNSQ